jgi:hypothetical protein
MNLVYILSSILAILSFFHYFGRIDMSIGIWLIALAAFVFVLEDITSKVNVKKFWNGLAIFLLFLALVVPYFQSLLSKELLNSLRNLSDLLTVLSVCILIIFKKKTSDRIAKEMQIINRHKKECSVSEIQSALKIGEKAYVVTDGSFKQQLVERGDDGTIFWASYGMGSSKLNPNSKVEKDLRFKILP